MYSGIKLFFPDKPFALIFNLFPCLRDNLIEIAVYCRYRNTNNTVVKYLTLEPICPPSSVGRALDHSKPNVAGSIPTAVKQFFSLPSVDTLRVTSEKKSFH